MKKIVSCSICVVMIIMSGCSGEQAQAVNTSGDVTEKTAVTEQPSQPLTAGQSEQNELNSAALALFDLSATEFVAGITVGWNLGNTLDALSFSDEKDNTSTETGWGNPRANAELFAGLKAAGFDAVRLPTTWWPHLDADNNINTEWLDRVQAVVDMALEQDLYIILNTHHEGHWLYPSYANEDGLTEKLTDIWAQIADRFKDYDGRLIFETLNEPKQDGGENEWNGGTEESRTVVSNLNLAALETIRKSGGHNDKRFVMLPTNAASKTETALSAWEKPDGDDHIIVSIHAYDPYNFALNGEGSSKWYPTDGMKDELDRTFQPLYDKFISKGIPVIMGESGAQNKENLGFRVAWADYYFGRAAEQKIPVFWWDNGVITGDGEKFGLIDRETGEQVFPELTEAMIAAAKAGEPLYPISQEEAGKLK